jgi:mannose-1-phosphate guanylyltransferase
VFNEMIVSPEYCVHNKGETMYRGDDNCRLRWSDARA